MCLFYLILSKRLPSNIFLDVKKKIRNLTKSVCVIHVLGLIINLKLEKKLMRTEITIQNKLFK